MLITIHETDPRPIYQQIVDEVRRAVVVGTLLPDDPLPSVRQLATDLRVNPNTVHQAYRELEREGLAYGRRGQGTFVARQAADAAGALADALAERALREAYRNGLGAEEFLEAVRRVAERDAVPARAKGGR